MHNFVHLSSQTGR